MTNNLKIGDNLLLPVTFDGMAMADTGHAWVVSNGYRTMGINPIDVAALIPASALTDLQAEVTRLRALVEEAYREGWDDGMCSEWTYVPAQRDILSEDWRDSIAIKKLNPAPSEKGVG